MHHFDLLAFDCGVGLDAAGGVEGFGVWGGLFTPPFFVIPSLRGLGSDIFSPFLISTFLHYLRLGNSMVTFPRSAAKYIPGVL